MAVRIYSTLLYSWLGVIGNKECDWMPTWTAYLCRPDRNYEALIIESLDSDTETRRVTPIAILGTFWHKVLYAFSIAFLSYSITALFYFTLPQNFVNPTCAIMRTVVAIYCSIRRSSGKNHGSDLVLERTSRQLSMIHATAWHCSRTSGTPSLLLPDETCCFWNHEFHTAIGGKCTIHTYFKFTMQQPSPSSTIYFRDKQRNYSRWAPHNWSSQSNSYRGWSYLLPI